MHNRSIASHVAFAAVRIAALAFAALVMLPERALACACGCAVFDVGTSSLLPAGPGGTVFAEYDFLNQNTNWSGTSRAPAAANGDKEIRSSFFLFGGQYMFDASWGVMVELPFTNRYFRTTDEDSGDIVSFDHTALGDIRLMGVYSGFAQDMSTGVVFGVKLPTGDSTFAGFDPDTEIGSGSTDLLVGFYHTGALAADQSFSYFAQVLWQHEVSLQNAYRPGPELNGAVGVSYNNWVAGGVHLAPILQLIVSNRGRDGGLAGDRDNTGYTRLIVSPGFEIDRGDWKLYADAEVPAYQHMNGDQLVAPVAVKFILSRSF